VNKMTLKFLASMIFAISTTLLSQFCAIPFPCGAAALAVAPVSCGSSPYSDNFAGTGPLSSCWTNTTSTAVPAGGGSWGPISRNADVAQSFGSEGLAIYTGGTFAANQYSQVTIPNGTSAGPCIRCTVSGNGYVWVSNSGVHIYTAGTIGNRILRCNNSNVPNARDVLYLSAVGSTITCTDVTSGVTESATDTTYSTGSPGIYTGVYRPDSAFSAGSL